MTVRDDGGPAMPCTQGSVVYQGISVRDWFAAMAMQGLLSNPKLHAEILKQGGAKSGWIESSAFGWADAMLTERSK